MQQAVPLVPIHIRVGPVEKQLLRDFQLPFLHGTDQRGLVQRGFGVDGLLKEEQDHVRVFGVVDTVDGEIEGVFTT